MTTSFQVIYSLIVKAGWLNSETLNRALAAYQSNQGKRALEDVLFQGGYISKDQYQWLKKALATFIKTQTQSEGSTQTPVPSSPSLLPPLRGNFSKYEVVEELGRGGMGTVYLARDGDLNRLVALKVTKKGTQADLVRFLKEAQMGSQLEHPGVAPIYDAGKTPEGKVYFAMKYIEGHSLAEVLAKLAARDGQFVAAYPLRRRLDLFCKILEAISFAHSHQIIHRDLKPDNIMIGLYGEVWVVDWGLAKSLGEEGEERRGALDEEDRFKTRAGAIVGTPAYMPPEQALGELEKISYCSDLYSLGVILYELLTLKRAFAGDNPISLLREVIEGNYPLPRQVAEEELPRPLEAIVLKSMAREADQRYSSALAIHDDIQAYLDDRPVSVYTPPRSEKLSRWLKGHSTALSVTVLVFAVISVFTYFLARSNHLRFLQEQDQLKLARQAKQALFGKLEAQKAKEKAIQAEKKALEQEQKATRELMRELKKNEIYKDSLLKAQVPFRIAKNIMAYNIKCSLLKQIVIPKLKKALEIQPQFMPARLQLIRVYFYLDKGVAKAVPEFLQLIKNLPSKEKKVRTLFSKIAFSIGMGTRVQLPKDFDSNKPAFLDQVDWILLKILLLFETKQYQQAYREVDRILAQPELRSWEAFYLKGVMAYQMGRIDEAGRLYRQMAREYPRIPFIYGRWAEVLKEKGQRSEALRAYQTLVELDPSYPVLWSGLAEMENVNRKEWIAQKQPTKGLVSSLAALRYLTRAFHLDSDNILAKEIEKEVRSGFLSLVGSPSPDPYSEQSLQCLARRASSMNDEKVKKEWLLFLLGSPLKKPGSSAARHREKYFPQALPWLESYLKGNRDPVDCLWIQEILKDKGNKR